MTRLLDPLRIGGIDASNRVWMAPCQRSRATRDHVATPIMAEYYAQRAQAGLIISESNSISPQGAGWPFGPGIWSEEQVEAWKLTTSAVHRQGGKIIAQLNHMGRAAHSNDIGEQPVSSSATAFPSPVHTYAGKLEPDVARPLSISEINQVVSDFGIAAKNAIRAGFDGVHVHGANGYLIDQFLEDSANLRVDEYGGSTRNRVRFLEEVMIEVVKAVGSERTSLRLSPNGCVHGVRDSDSMSLAMEVAERLNKLDLAFIELRELGPSDLGGLPDDPKLHGVFNELYDGVLVLNQGYTRENAENALQSGIASAITFGRAFMANPDLVEKIRRADDDWTESDMNTWYSQGPKGYIDYPIRYRLT